MRLTLMLVPLAVDDDGNKYPIKGRPAEYTIPVEEIDGELITFEEQVRYSDGSYAREIREITYFVKK